MSEENKCSKMMSGRCGGEHLFRQADLSYLLGLSGTDFKITQLPLMLFCEKCGMTITADIPMGGRELEMTESEIEDLAAEGYRDGTTGMGE